MNDDGQYHPDYSVYVPVISAISCSLSILGGAIIFATFILIPEIRYYARKLVVCLTVADVISAAAYLVSVIRYANTDNSEENVLCKIQSFCTTYSSIVSFCLTSIIAIYIFDTVVNKTDRLGSICWLVVFNVISWVIPGKHLWFISFSIKYFKLLISKSLSFFIFRNTSLVSILDQRH